MMTNILVLGAAGVVGFSVCDAWLKEEDSVVYVVD
jgi:nucleoside-diphosphate-sugar epimerase